MIDLKCKRCLGHASKKILYVTKNFFLKSKKPPPRGVGFDRCFCRILAMLT
jgi:hypothetical protein